MGLLEKFRQSKTGTVQDLRRYAALLEVDDVKTFDELVALAHKLDKDSSAVESDRHIIKTAPSLANKIKEGHGSATALETVNHEVAAQEQETRALINQRKALAKPLHSRHAS